MDNASHLAGGLRELLHEHLFNLLHRSLFALRRRFYRASDEDSWASEEPQESDSPTCERREVVYRPANISVGSSRSMQMDSHSIVAKTSSPTSSAPSGLSSVTLLPSSFHTVSLSTLSTLSVQLHSILTATTSPTSGVVLKKPTSFSPTSSGELHCPVVRIFKGCQTFQVVPNDTVSEAKVGRGTVRTRGEVVQDGGGGQRGGEDDFVADLHEWDCHRVY